MATNKFNNKVKIKCLQCCDRHCCWCEKECSTKIEIHHIVSINEKGDSSFDNAIPLCFDCHSEVKLYNKEHPKGTKYRPEELKEKRNHIYNKYTSHLVPTIGFTIESFDSQTKPTDARFKISNTHPYLTCKVKFIFSIYHNSRIIYRWKDGIYGGKTPWIFNPNQGGNFPPNFLHMEEKKLPKKIGSLQVQIETTIIDKFGWEHELLPVSWIWTKNDGWFFHPFLKE